MFILSKLLVKLKLVFPDPLEEKEFARLKAPLTKSSLTWLFVFTALVFVPLTFRYFDKHLSPQKYLGIGFIVCAVLIFLFRNMLRKWLELLSLIYVALMTILYIINMRLILKKQAPYEAFYMGYGLALIGRLLDFRIGHFAVIAAFQITFNVLKFTLVPIPDPALAGLVICLEVFPLIIGFKSERSDRSLFDNLYNSKQQLLKFKNFMTECLPSQIVILDQEYSNILFSNNPFNEVFQCKSISEVKKSFQEMIIENKSFEQNPTLSELLDTTAFDNLQPLTFSNLIDLITKKKDLLQGLKSTKLQVIQQIIENQNFYPKNGSPSTRTKETQAKEEDLILLKKDQRTLYTQNFNQILDPERLESSLELDHLPETNRQEPPRGSTHIIKRDWNIRVFPITWDKSEAIAIVLDDVTYEKTITDLQVADQNKKDLVIALISHELKTPLNGMLGMLEIVKKSLRNIEAIKQTDVFWNLDACKNNSLIFLNLINSIVDFSKIKTDKLKLTYSKVSLHELMKKTTPLFEHVCRAKKLSLKIEIDENVQKSIITDRNRLSQILIYLLGNAFKFTFTGGITLRVQLENKCPSHLRFSVEDTGIGIAPKDKEKLFKLFGVAEQKNTTINTHGLGLGLTISNTLVRMLNSVQKGIEVESELDKGTSFSFLVQDRIGESTNTGSQRSDEKDYTEIPSFGTLEEQRDFMSVQDRMIAYSDPKEKNNLESAQPLSISKYAISADLDERNLRHPLNEKPWCLVVDDNPFNLMVAHNMMEEKGYNIKTALNGREAIERVQEHQRSQKSFQIILMDCQMPVMDGYESTKTIKRLMSEGAIKDCPIVALTANAKDAKHDRLSEEVGMSGFIPKPLQVVELEKVLKDVYKRNSYQEMRSPVKQIE